METRFRRYLTLRRLNSEPSQTGHALDDLDFYSVPYETTSPGMKAPVFISQPLRKSAIAAKRMPDEFDGLAIRAISYDSVLPGKPPVLGGRPYKGNGPIKLQTSRRLSSGELLTTTQDNQRTLEDIREGDYIVGRKEKRYSQLSQVKTSSPSLAALASPRFPPESATATPRQSSFPEQRQQLPSPTLRHSDVSASPMLGSSVIDSPPATPGLSLHELLPPDSGYGIRTGGNEHSSAYAMPPTATRAMVPSSTTSLLTKGEEQNTTIQALWKAEYGRLVAIYGQDGVDRNIAELNRDHQSTPSLDVADGSHDHQTSPAIMLQPLPRPSFDAGYTSNSARNSRGSFARDSSTFDDASEYSSQKPSSIMSSEGSSSSYTKRTSLYDTDLPTTREDVRRVVESMRANYLQAIESTAKVTERTKSKRKPRVRTSLPNASAAGSSQPLAKAPKTARQSWHGSNAQETAKADKKKAKTKSGTDRTPSSVLKTSASKSSIKSKASLQRADSLTLGALVPDLPSPEKEAKPGGPLGGSSAAQNGTAAQRALSSSIGNRTHGFMWATREQTVNAI